MRIETPPEEVQWLVHSNHWLLMKSPSRQEDETSKRESQVLDLESLIAGLIVSKYISTTSPDS